MNNDNTDFDVEQCREDAFECEAVFNGSWLVAKYLCTHNGRHIVAFGELVESKRPQHIRNIPKKKPMRWKQMVMVCMGENAKERYVDVTVPFVVNSEGQPIVDHSDAIIKVLDNVLDAYANLENPLWVLVRNEIDRIKKERGDL